MSTSKLTKFESRITPVDISRGSNASTARIRGRHLDRIRARILLRDEYTCQLCGRVTLDLEVDHKIPLAIGGRETDENRQAICPIPCHKEKTAREEKERGNKY